MQPGGQGLSPYPTTDMEPSPRTSSTPLGASLARVPGPAWTHATGSGVSRGIHGATPNLQELEDWAGRLLEDDEQVAEAAEALRHALGARFVLATRGNRGMTLVESGRGPADDTRSSAPTRWPM